jgi:hypothetical protein
MEEQFKNIVYITIYALYKSIPNAFWGHCQYPLQVHLQCFIQLALNISYKSISSELYELL